MTKSPLVFERISDALGTRIAQGEIKEGEPLPKETELQDEFAAGRQAVREALKVLATKGLIRARKRAGTFVCPRDDWDMLDARVLSWHRPEDLPLYVLRDLVDLRRAVEPRAASLAAERADPASLAKLETALSRMHAELDDKTAFYAADIDFHLAIFEASGNTLIQRLSSILTPLLKASFALQEQHHSSLKEGYEAHIEVLEAIKRNDGSSAAAMEELLNRATTEIYRSSHS
ncbi:FadR/GntR family transcriptional regulator [Falsihalocynthiibacter sp. SS001]|uniref:FadR/GntR family transcriptional regulator n=1 Tax=Falsihalocynthiibacter sp. SS001 TaxID=3349698 RepID=UPI0036D33E25